VPYIWCPENFRESSTRVCPRPLFPKFSMGFVRINPMNVPTKFVVRSLNRSCGNRGYSKKWAVPGYAHAAFSLKFLVDLFGWTVWMYQPNLKVRSFGRSWDNSNWSFGWELRTPNLGEEEAVGVGDVTVWKSVGELRSCRLLIVTFSLSLRVSEILPLLCSSRPLFHTPPLVSAKFPYIPLGIGGWPLGYDNSYEERRCLCN